MRPVFGGLFFCSPPCPPRVSRSAIALPQVLEERGIKENMRFDPKLKGKGLLDLLMAKPDTSVPK